MIFIVIGLILLIYLLTIAAKSTGRLNIRATKIIRVILLLSTPLLVALLILSQYNIYPRGYWVTKILFWVIIFLMMILFGLGNKSAINRFERIVYGFFYYLPVAFIPFLLIPFIGIGTALLFYVSFIGDKSFILYSDNDIRIERQGITFLGPAPPLEIYVKDGFISYKDTVLPFGYIDLNDRLVVRRLNESTYHLIHYSPDNWQVPAGFQEFKYSVKKK